MCKSPFVQSIFSLSKSLCENAISRDSDCRPGARASCGACGDKKEHQTVDIRHFTNIHHRQHHHHHSSSYELSRDPTPFNYYRTRASRMVHRLRQTSIIFRHVEFLLARRLSKWTNSAIYIISIYYMNEYTFWETDPLSLLTNSLVATCFRILFPTVKLNSFQRCSRRGNQGRQAWETKQARARIQRRRQRASKRDRGETKGHKLGKQGGSDKFEQSAKM